MRELISGLALFILNAVVSRIPCWPIRKAIFRLYGMKIGKGSRILMACRFQRPRGIAIGENSYVNAYCHLDGRGGLNIGNNVNISNYCKIITASHDMHSATFAYRTGRVDIDDHVWLGTGAIVLDRSHLGRAMVLSAGSVFKGEGLKGGVYAGIPAKYVKNRELEEEYNVVWRPWFM